MTADVELLPLPEWAAHDETVADMSTSDVREAMNDHARACVAHATAAKDAEIQALRAQLATAYRVKAECNDEANRQRNRAKQLEEALRDTREYVTAALQAQREAFAGHEDCSDIPGIEADLHKIDALLREQGEGK